MNLDGPLSANGTPASFASQEDFDLEIMELELEVAECKTTIGKLKSALVTQFQALRSGERQRGQAAGASRGSLAPAAEGRGQQASPDVLSKLYIHI